MDDKPIVIIVVIGASFRQGHGCRSSCRFWNDVVVGTRTKGKTGMLLLVCCICYRCVTSTTQISLSQRYVTHSYTTGLWRILLGNIFSSRSSPASRGQVWHLLAAQHHYLVWTAGFGQGNARTKNGRHAQHSTIVYG
jgi:hypothetical protein